MKLRYVVMLSLLTTRSVLGVCEWGNFNLNGAIGYELLSNDGSNEDPYTALYTSHANCNGINYMISCTEYPGFCVHI